MPRAPHTLHPLFLTVNPPSAAPKAREGLEAFRFPYIRCTMLRGLAHPQIARQFARSFHNLSLHRLGHQPLQNRLYTPAVFGVTRLPERADYLNAVGHRRVLWAGQVAGFHSTRRNEGMPLVPFFAAMLKVRLSRIRTSVDPNPMFKGIRFHGTRPNRKQGSTLTRPFALRQEP